MKTKIVIICGLFLLCLLSCGSKRVARSTTFYQLAGTDTMLLSDSLLSVDSLSLLLVSLSDDTSRLMSAWDLKWSRNYEDMLNRSVQNPLSTGWSGKIYVFGDIHNHFWNTIVLNRVAEEMSVATSAEVYFQKDRSEVMDSVDLVNLLEKEKVDGVIALDSLFFQFNQAESHDIQYLDKKFTMRMGSLFFHSSTQTSVGYRSYWSFVWKKGAEIKRERILQTGELYEENEEGNPMQFVLNCAYKVGADFVKLVR